MGPIDVESGEFDLPGGGTDVWAKTLGTWSCMAWGNKLSKCLLAFGTKLYLVYRYKFLVLD